MNDDKSAISFKNKIKALKISQERLSSNSSSGIESSSDLDTEIEKCDKLLNQTCEIISLPLEDENSHDILVVNQNPVDTLIQSSENSSMFTTISTEPKTNDEENFSSTSNNLFLCCENKSEETTSFIDKSVFTNKEVNVLNNGESGTNDKDNENLLDASTDKSKMNSTLQNKNDSDKVGSCKESICTSNNCLNSCNIENKAAIIKSNDENVIFKNSCIPSKPAEKKLNCKVGKKTNKHASNSSSIEEKLENKVRIGEMSDKKENEPVELYLELEKDDITDPGWEKMKDLTTDAERYKVVKQCWKSETVPNINKNLTNHAYRKKRSLSSKEYFLNHRPKQHKRHASCALDRYDTKRARSCTVMLDKQINSINQQKNKCAETIQKQMDEELNQLNRKKIYNLYHRNAYQQTLIAAEASLISEDYYKQFHNKNYEFENKLNFLNRIREEILQFHSFYKGLNVRNDCEDPTVLTNSQFNEINEIESIYPQFNKIYNKSKNN